MTRLSLLVALTALAACGDSDGSSDASRWVYSVKTDALRGTTNTLGRLPADRIGSLTGLPIGYLMAEREPGKPTLIWINSSIDPYQTALKKNYCNPLSPAQIRLDGGPIVTLPCVAQEGDPNFSSDGLVVIADNLANRILSASHIVVEIAPSPTSGGQKFQFEFYNDGFRGY